MDLIAATNAPVTFTLDGEEYPVRSLKLKEWGELQAWLVKAHPSPLARAAATIRDMRARGEEVDPDTEESLLDHAQREMLAWPPRVGSREWVAALDAADGGTVQFLLVALRPTMPDFDRAKAEALASRAPADWIQALFRFSLYGIRADASPKKDDPAPPPAG